MFTRDQRSRIIQVSFTFMVPNNSGNLHVQILGVEFKDIDSCGNVTNRTGTTKINCFFLTTYNFPIPVGFRKFRVFMSVRRH